MGGRLKPAPRNSPGERGPRWSRPGTDPLVPCGAGNRRPVPRRGAGEEPGRSRRSLPLRPAGLPAPAAAAAKGRPGRARLSAAVPGGRAPGKRTGDWSSQLGSRPLPGLPRDPAARRRQPPPPAASCRAWLPAQPGRGGAGGAARCAFAVRCWRGLRAAPAVHGPRPGLGQSPQLRHPQPFPGCRRSSRDTIRVSPVPFLRACLVKAMAALSRTGLMKCTVCFSLPACCLCFLALPGCAPLVGFVRLFPKVWLLNPSV